MSERAMPSPDCTGQGELDLGVIDFGRRGRRQVEGRFDGGSMTSDGGVMLLSASDRKIGLTAAAARCIADLRNPLLITHAVRDMLRQRVYGLALGWEDLNDHKSLRQDMAMQTVVGVDREVACAPTLAAPPAIIGSLQPSSMETRLMRAVNALNAGWLLGALGVIKPLAAKTFDYIPYTPLFNVTGQPAMSVPQHWNAEGLPIGTQSVADLGRDDLLFRLAGPLERARTWRDRVPPGT